MTKNKTNGFIAAPMTAFNADESVDLDIIPLYAEFLRSNGAVGVFVNGTTGEGLSLTVEERMAVAERWVKAAPEGFNVIVHVSHTCPGSAEKMARHAADIGAYGIGEMGQIFFKPKSVEELVRLSSQTADQAPDLAYYYYHMPSMSGVYFAMLDFLKAAETKIPNLTGIKYTHEDLVDFEFCREFNDGRYDILYGRDETLICALALGCHSSVGSTYNIMAPLYSQLINTFDSGDLEQARRLQCKSMNVIKLIYDTGSFNSALKAVMKMIGLDLGDVRIPLNKITQEQISELKWGLEELGFFDFCCKW